MSIGRSMPTPSTPPSSLGKRKSFAAIEAKAREVLRERGLTEAQIEAELKRGKRGVPKE
jgi:hypothetical protein